MANLSQKRNKKNENNYNFVKNKSNLVYCMLLNNVVFLQEMFDAKRLSERIDVSGKTRKQIAEDAKISIQTLYNYEEGRREPMANIIPRLAKAINTTTAYLYKEIDDPSPNALKFVEVNLSPKPWEIAETGKEQPTNFRTRSGSGELADKSLMELLEEKMATLDKLIHEKEKQIRSNPGSIEKNDKGN